MRGDASSGTLCQVGLGMPHGGTPSESPYDEILAAVSGVDQQFSEPPKSFTGVHLMKLKF